jgi:2-polyprenyl-3-methyl-5-hydroxy-6-metoxy-1,4-benzoquinol methylase
METISKKEFFSLVAGKIQVGQYIHQHYSRFIKTINKLNTLFENSAEKGEIKLLDFGSLEGVLGITLKAFGYDIHCIDLESVISAHLHNYTDNDLKVEFLTNNWAKLPYPDDYFDCVIFTEVLEHLYESPIKYLEEFYRILKKGGYLLITTPNVMRIENKIKFFLNINIYQDINRFCYNPRYTLHYREYSKGDLEIMLGEYLGFRNLRFYMFDYLGGRTRMRRRIQRVIYLVNSVLPMFKACILAIAQK